jgi:hypothetical protein
VALASEAAVAALASEAAMAGLASEAAMAALASEASEAAVAAVTAVAAVAAVAALASEAAMVNSFLQTKTSYFSMTLIYECKLFVKKVLLLQQMIKNLDRFI